jgi:hypothetical protein
MGWGLFGLLMIWGFVVTGGCDFWSGFCCRELLVESMIHYNLDQTLFEVDDISYKC